VLESNLSSGDERVNITLRTCTDFHLFLFRHVFIVSDLQHTRGGKHYCVFKRMGKLINPVNLKFTETVFQIKFLADGIGTLPLFQKSIG
jgi:hypothetical protein